MSLRKLLTCLPLLALMAVPPAADAKNANSKKHRITAKDSVEWRSRTDRARYQTRGHRPHDRNGDGMVTRDEWPGNDVSFRQLDRNGDGVISNADRATKRKAYPTRRRGR